MIESKACFDANIVQNPLDQKAFKFQHSLLGHPAMQMANLAHVIPSLPEDQVYYSSGKLDTGANFARTYLDHKNGLTIEETVHSMKTSDSFIMVRGPESHPSFHDLFQALCANIDTWLKANRMGSRTIDPMLYLFVASPKSVTPFHIDRISTVLMQFQGSKKVTIFPAWDERTVPSEVLESFMVRSGRSPQYDSSFESMGEEFDFGPGEALHIPFVAPHHVKNGDDEVSLSLSITFHSSHSEKLKEAMFLNQLMRKRLKVRPSPVGRYEALDLRKAKAYRGYTKLRDAFKCRA